MKKHLAAVFWTMLFLCPRLGAAGALDPARYLAQRGWTPFEGSKPVQLPQAGIAALRYYEQGRSVPSCGILTARSGRAAPQFIDLVSSDAGENYPQCLGIGPIAQFRLQGRAYAVVGFDFRETGQDFYRSYHYLYQNGQQGYLSDKALNRLVPDIDLQEAGESGRKGTDGVKAARTAYFKGAFPHLRFLERDFISGPQSSFAMFDNRQTRQCYLALETGSAPVLAAHTEFMPGTQCSAVLATTALDKGDMTYYLALLGAGAGKQLAAIASVNRAGKITLEKALTSAVNTSGATGNARTAKAALSKLLH